MLLRCLRGDSAGQRPAVACAKCSGESHVAGLPAMASTAWTILSIYLKYYHTQNLVFRVQFGPMQACCAGERVCVRCCGHWPPGVLRADEASTALQARGAPWPTRNLVTLGEHVLCQRRAACLELCRRRSSAAQVRRAPTQSLGRAARPCVNITDHRSSSEDIRLGGVLGGGSWVPYTCALTCPGAAIVAGGVSRLAALHPLLAPTAGAS